MMEAHRYLNPKQVSERFGIRVSTLAHWRCQGTQMPYHKIGKKVVYRESTLLKFFEEREVRVGKIETN